MKYFVTVGERTLEVDIDGDRVRMDGQELHASLTTVPETPEVRLEVAGRVSSLAVDRYVDGRWRLVDRGSVYDIEAVDERTRHIRSLVGAERGTAGGGQLKAPMPGLVIQIAVAEGDRVTAGQGLVVLEAMKMENELKVTAAGVVNRVRVAVGQAVEKGQVLLDITPADEAA